MSTISHHSSVHFTDSSTLENLKKAGSGIVDKKETAHLISVMFDATRTRVAASMCENPEEGCMKENRLSREELRKELSDRFVEVIQLLTATLDLRSKEWKNAPAIWELLSFDEYVLHDEDTPLPEALRDAMSKTQHLFDHLIDPIEFIEDLDEVIHQTYGRRIAIERVMKAAMHRDVADTPLLHTGSIPNVISSSVREQIVAELNFADGVIADAAAEAICRACDELNASEIFASAFTLDKTEVERVTGEQAMSSKVGDVYLVRSQNVPGLGDHYIVIIGGLVQKPHGLRPEDIHYEIPNGQFTPLDEYDAEEQLVLLKLNDAARLRFYDAFGVDPNHRRA